ncbi:hypothetical protein DU445_18435 [Shigella dysenteriae]|uniref:Uncharacterized protein n=1 Tax=Shigella dysenteriae TaxID=622 RepID=A0A3P6M9Z2_SHIDY|nr:hypothetical protein [Shigella dysenteriae]EFV9746401.1 hypothetical protein [Shigella flexneri]EFY9109437.1 hypothetical protein [Shigella sonnei]EFV8869411.1 hypothetical protein [Shigella dysenteriae]EFV8873457.1 hypothetical protein [Shigella dysenteriae]
MHSVLGTMMPEICKAPHLPVFPFPYHSALYLIGGNVFITFIVFFMIVFASSVVRHGKLVLWVVSLSLVNCLFLFRN